MRILHTSDWHLGARLGRHDRQVDHLVAVRALIKLAEEQRPDLILHTGDLFDAFRPTDDALSLAIGALRRLAAVAPTVVLCGNHDSSRFFRSLDDLAQMSDPRRLWFVTEPRVLTFVFDGRPVAVASLPFIFPSVLADIAKGRIGEFAGVYADGIAKLNDALLEEASEIAGSSGVVLYAAHLHVHGAVPGQSEKRMTVGDDFATHTNGLHRAMYAAFGHIHDPQLLPGGAVVGRYAGSLIPIDFGEQSQAKSAVLVDVGRDVKVRPVELPTGRPLTQIRGTLEEFLDRASDGALNGHLLKARVRTDEPAADLVDQLLARSPQCDVFELTNEVANRQITPIDVDDESLALGAEPPLAELFHEWRQTAATSRQRQAPDEVVNTLFAAAIGGSADNAPDLGVSSALNVGQKALDQLKVHQGRSLR